MRRHLVIDDYNDLVSGHWDAGGQVLMYNVLR